MIDASKHFIKVGKNNHLQASDIKRIVDCVTHRRELPKFSALCRKPKLWQTATTSTFRAMSILPNWWSNGIFSPPCTAAFPKPSWHNLQAIGKPLTACRLLCLPITAHLMCSRKPTISKLPCKATTAC